MCKLYSAEDIEIGKYYNRGYGNVYQLLERTGKTVESYPGVFSNIYKFQVFNIESGAWWSEDVVLNPKYTYFSELDTKRISEIISSKTKYIESLKLLLRQYELH